MEKIQNEIQDLRNENVHSKSDEPNNLDREIEKSRKAIIEEMNAEFSTIWNKTNKAVEDLIQTKNDLKKIQATFEKMEKHMGKIEEDIRDERLHNNKSNDGKSNVTEDGPQRKNNNERTTRNKYSNQRRDEEEWQYVQGKKDLYSNRVKGKNGATGYKLNQQSDSGVQMQSAQTGHGEQRWTSPINNRKPDKDKIIVIGSSMVRNINKVVGMNVEGSFLRSIGGAGIKQIISEAINAAETATNNTKMFIQGGGNSLKTLGVDETVRSYVEGLREISRKNGNITTVVLSIIPRPREDFRYEQTRCRVNMILKEEIIKLYHEGIKVTFMNADPAINSECFSRDGVHFNYVGNGVLGRVIINVMRQAANIRLRAGSRGMQ